MKKLTEMVENRKKELRIEERKIELIEMLLENGMEKNPDREDGAASFYIPAIQGTNLLYQVVITNYSILIRSDYKDKNDEWFRGEDDVIVDFAIVEKTNLEFLEIIIDRFSKLLSHMIRY